MPTLKIELDIESHKKLIAVAAEERRPLDWQAEVMIMQALGRWPVPKDRAPAVKTEEAAHVD